MSKAIHITTARSMLNSGDPVDISVWKAKRLYSRTPELMSALRSENLRGDLTDKRKEIVRQTQAQIVGYLRSGSFNSRRLADIVNYIRLNPESFSEWRKSVIA